MTQKYGDLSFNHIVESNTALDRIFGALANMTRRDILKRVSRAEHTISELAEPYAMSLAAIAKHVSVLEKAGLNTKRRSGKEKVIQIQPKTIEVATTYLSKYEKIWITRFDVLEKRLEDNAAYCLHPPHYAARRDDADFWACDRGTGCYTLCSEYAARRICLRSTFKMRPDIF